VPSTITWTGAAPTRATVKPFTVVSGSDTTTYKLTGGNGKFVTYTAAGGDNATTIATQLAAAWAASTEPELKEVTATSALGVVTLTGPADGRPFTATPSVSGGVGTLTAGTVTVGTSPNHLSSVGNYSGGALPGAGDTLVIENWTGSILWDLDSLTAVTVKVTRRATHVGSIGLPDANGNGYPEYRPRYLETAGVTHLIELSGSEAAKSLRLKSTAGSAVTLTASGTGARRGVGSEPVEVHGTPAASVFNVSGAGLAVAPLAGQVATVATILADANSAVRLGSGVTLTSLTLNASAGLLACGWTNLTLDKVARCTATGAAAGTNTTVYSGTLTWTSSGNPGAVVLGGAGVFDANSAPAAFAVTSVTADKGATVRDRAARITRPVTVVHNRCGLGDVKWDAGTNLSVTVSAGP
jgi:hypothetical protein